LALLSIFALILPFSGLRVFSGVILVLVLPGYAMLALLFPQRQELDAVVHAGLAIVSSMVITAAIAFLFAPFNQLHRLLSSTSVVLAISVTVMGLATLAQVIRCRRGVRWRLVLASANKPFPISRLLAIAGLSLVILTVSGFVFLPGLAGFAKSAREEFTYFGLSDVSGQAVPFPSWMRAGESQLLGITVANHSLNAHRYRAEAWLDNYQAGQTNATVESGAVWNSALPISIPAGQPAGEYRLSLKLYQDDQNAPERSLSIVLSVFQDSPEFYFLDRRNAPARYPQEVLPQRLVSGRVDTLSLGIVNRDATVREHRLEAWTESIAATCQGSNRTPLPNARYLIGESPTIMVETGAEWRGKLDIAVPNAVWGLTTCHRAIGQIAILLYRDGQPEPTERLFFRVGIDRTEPTLFLVGVDGRPMPASGSVYPFELSTGESHTISLGIQNTDKESRWYGVSLTGKLSQDTHPRYVWAPAGALVYHEIVVLPSQSAASIPLVFTLFREGTPVQQVVFYAIVR
jgi:uncharacterized membrane protein